MSNIKPVSVGTFDDVMGTSDPQPIDRNPSIDCCGCGESFDWMDYWKGRVDSPDDEFRCDDCQKEKDRHERRVENNQKITEWSK